jgi:hypothetical protein
MERTMGCRFSAYSRVRQGEDTPKLGGDMTEDSHRRYLLLLPAPEEEWARLPDSDHELGMKNHQQFHEALAARGHKLVMANPLEPSQQAISMRNVGRGSAIVTDGPFTEAAEQMVGFYLIDSGDEPDLLEIVRSFAEGGDHVEFRGLATG